MINVIAISLSSFEKSTVTFAGSKHRSYLSLIFVFLKVPLNMLFNFLTLLTWFSFKKNKNAYIWALGPLGPRAQKKAFLFFLQENHVKSVRKLKSIFNGTLRNTKIKLRYDRCLLPAKVNENFSKLGREISITFIK